jgi:hypothetical protein
VERPAAPLRSAPFSSERIMVVSLSSTVVDTAGLPSPALTCA